jgi:hypothetical protein
MRLCDQLGLTDDVARTGTDGDDMEVLGAFATGLTSYGNGLGDSGRLEEAREAFAMSLLARPDHVPTWMSCALVEAALGSRAVATNWADKVLAFRPDSRRRDSLSLGAAAMFNSPAWKELTEQMRQIRDGG